MQVIALGCERSAIRWAADMAPQELQPLVQSMMEEGARATVAEQHRRAASEGKAPERSWFTA